MNRRPRAGPKGDRGPGREPGPAFAAEYRREEEDLWLTPVSRQPR